MLGEDFILLRRKKMVWKTFLCIGIDVSKNCRGPAKNTNNNKTKTFIGLDTEHILEMYLTVIKPVEDY